MFKEWLMENSTEDAKKTLVAIIKTLEDAKNDDSKKALDMAMGIMDYYDKEGSFSPAQASWIYKFSKSLFN